MPFSSFRCRFRNSFLRSVAEIVVPVKSKEKFKNQTIYLSLMEKKILIDCAHATLKGALSIRQSICWSVRWSIGPMVHHGRVVCVCVCVCVSVSVLRDIFMLDV